MNESLINAAYAGYFNVPVGLVIGDDALRRQLEPDDAMPWVEYVETKYSLSRFSVKSKPINVVRNETTKAVKKVLESDLSKIPVYKFEPPIKLNIEFETASMTDVVCMIPGIKRIDGIHIEYVRNDYAELFNAIDAISALAGSVKW